MSKFIYNHGGDYLDGIQSEFKITTELEDIVAYTFDETTTKLICDSVNFFNAILKPGQKVFILEIQTEGVIEEVVLCRNNVLKYRVVYWDKDNITKLESLFYTEELAIETTNCDKHAIL
jgi:hypothetical protein